MSLYKIGRYLFGIDSSTKDRTANEDIDSLYSNTEEEHDNVNLHSSFSYTTNNDLLPINEQCQGNGTLPQINDTSEIINQGIAISHSTVSNTNHGQELRIINNSNFSLFFSGEFLYVSREQNVEDVLYNLQFPLTTNIDTFETLSCVLTRIVVEYFLYYFSLDFISVEKNFAKCLNNTGKTTSSNVVSSR